MIFEILNNSINNIKINNNFKKHNFYFNEFLENSFFKPLLLKDYYNNFNFRKLANKNNIVHIFGMGGSSLSSKVLLQFLSPKSLNKNFFFYDNPYDINIEKNLSNHKITKKDKFIFISKSGKTSETKYFLNFITDYLNKLKIKNYNKQIIFLCENTNNYFKNYAIKNNIYCFDHDKNIGGRFSLYSLAGILPLIIGGYSEKKIIKSATNALLQFSKVKSKFATKIIQQHLLQKKNNINIFIGLSYHFNLGALNEWYRQIFAESLGKDSNAITYISSLGPIDQHSQFQLYIDGPKDKSYLFFDCTSHSNKNSLFLKKFLSGAIKTLKTSNLVSLIKIKNNFVDYNILIIFLIYDIFLRSKVDNINFLNQPAVETLKKNTKV